MPWQPDRYRQFASERAAAFDDLLALITVRDGLRVIDLGCGSGELTARLADRLPHSEVVGIDTSPEMIAAAQAQRARPGLRFEQGAIEADGGQWDLIFSYAALQWVPDHRAVLPRWLDRLNPGGQVAMQIASNQRSPEHELLRETARQAPFHAALEGWTRPVHTLDTGAYAEILYRHRLEDITVFEKVYPAVLPDVAAALDWFAGTALIPYRERLPAALHADFLAAYGDRLRARWGTGPVFYSGQRLVLAARKPQPVTAAATRPAVHAKR